MPSKVSSDNSETGVFLDEAAINQPLLGNSSFPRNYIRKLSLIVVFEGEEKRKARWGEDGFDPMEKLTQLPETSKKIFGMAYLPLELILSRFWFK